MFQFRDRARYDRLYRVQHFGGSAHAADLDDRHQDVQIAQIEPQAERILQLRAAQLSEDDRLSEHLKKRPTSPVRQYKATKRRKAG